MDSVPDEGKACEVEDAATEFEMNQGIGSGDAGIAPTVGSKGPGRRLRLRSLVRVENRGEDRTGELAGQDVHVDLVPEAAVVPAAFSAAPHLAEADLLVAPPAGAVVLEDGQHDAVHTEDGEGVVEEEPHRLRAVATTPRVRLADHDADDGAPVGKVHLMQPTVTNRATRRSL